MLGRYSYTPTRHHMRWDCKSEGCACQEEMKSQTTSEQRKGADGHGSCGSKPRAQRRWKEPGASSTGGQAREDGL